MQRILHITGVMKRAGAETMLMNIYRNIDREKYQFDFVSFSDTQGDYDQEIISMGGIIHKITAIGPIKRMYSLKKLLLNHPEYKIVHCHTLLSNAFHVLAAGKAGVKLRIVHSHNTNDNTKSRFIRIFYHLFAKFVIQRYGTHFIACGEAAAQFLFPQKKNYLLLPNSIELKRFVEIGLQEKGYLRQKYSIPEDYLLIIQVGRLQSVKNHHFSIQIAKELKRRSVSFKMFFVGSGELEDELTNKIFKSALNNDVIMTGTRTDIAQLMAGADFMLMPSFFEGFPVVLVESQAIGLPALVSDRVSREVDLALDLVQFLPLTDRVDIWVEAMLTKQYDRKFTSTQRMNMLSAKGFDVKSSAHKLIDNYNQIT